MWKYYDLALNMRKIFHQLQSSMPENVFFFVDCKMQALQKKSMQFPTENPFWIENSAKKTLNFAEIVKRNLDIWASQ